jgi:hypothetical protein
MKRIRSIAVLLCLTVLFNNIYAQNQVNDKDDTFFWFSLKVNKKIDKFNHKPVTTIEKIYKNVYRGTFAQFAQSYKENLEKNKVCIGPFSSSKLAFDAQNYYKLTAVGRNNIQEQVKKLKIGNKEYFGYLTKPNIPEKGGTLSFERMAAHVSDMSIKQYFDVFFEGTTFELLLIGPFDNVITAEKSKYISRKYGEYGSGDTENNENIPEEIKFMAEAWKSVKIELSDSQFNQNKDTFSCKVNITFPPNYFEKEMTQIITFGYANNDTSINFPDGISLQGDAVRDNNTIISYELGGSVSYLLKTPYLQGKDPKIIVKSMILTDLNIFDCENIILGIKEE